MQSMIATMTLLQMQQQSSLRWLWQPGLTLERWSIATRAKPLADPSTHHFMTECMLFTHTLVQELRYGDFVQSPHQGKDLQQLSFTEPRQSMGSTERSSHTRQNARACHYAILIRISYSSKSLWIQIPIPFFFFYIQVSYHHPALNRCPHPCTPSFLNSAA